MFYYVVIHYLFIQLSLFIAVFFIKNVLKGPDVILEKTNMDESTFNQLISVFNQVLEALVLLNE